MIDKYSVPSDTRIQTIVIDLKNKMYIDTKMRLTDNLFNNLNLTLRGNMRETIENCRV